MSSIEKSQWGEEWVLETAIRDLIEKNEVWYVPFDMLLERGLVTSKWGGELEKESFGKIGFQVRGDVLQILCDYWRDKAIIRHTPEIELDWPEVALAVGQANMIIMITVQLKKLPLNVTFSYNKSGRDEIMLENVSVLLDSLKNH